MSAFARKNHGGNPCKLQRNERRKTRLRFLMYLTCRGTDACMGSRRRPEAAHAPLQRGNDGRSNTGPVRKTIWLIKQCGQSQISRTNAGVPPGDERSGLLLYFESGVFVEQIRPEVLYFGGGAMSLLGVIVGQGIQYFTTRDKLKHERHFAGSFRSAQQCPCRILRT